MRYVVMLELRDTGLLEQLDVISSVSGGSFTAAYYGLYGDRIFEDFEEGFLRRDAQGRLFRGLFNPFAAIGRWFGRRSRDEMAIDYYNEILCFTMPPLPI